MTGTRRKPEEAASEGGDEREESGAGNALRRQSGEAESEGGHGRQRLLDIAQSMPQSFNNWKRWLGSKPSNKSFC
jgi:hypothetical protein